jgi:hypothetical protein
MIATQYTEVALRVRIVAFLYIFDPCSVNGQRHFIFRFACSRARMTTDALALVDYPGEICHYRPARQMLPDGYYENLQPTTIA